MTEQTNSFLDLEITKLSFVSPKKVFSIYITRNQTLGNMLIELKYPSTVMDLLAKMSIVTR